VKEIGIEIKKEPWIWARNF